MQAYILVGGLGTRLRAAVPDLPKPLAPIHGRPFLAYVLDQLAAAGVREAVLCTGFRAALMRAHLGDRHEMLRLRYSEEDAPRGTGGALRLALERQPAPGAALVLNGDSYCDRNLGEFFGWFAATAAPAGMLLMRQEDCRRFGRVELDARGRITAFHEKSAPAAPGWINGGVYLLGPAALRELPAAAAFSLERDFFPALVARGELHGWPGPGRFLDIGTPDSYRAAENFFQPLTSSSTPASPRP